MAEELKPFVKAKWTDESDPSKGFDFLYLDEQDETRTSSNTLMHGSNNM